MLTYSYAYLVYDPLSWQKWSVCCDNALKVNLLLSLLGGELLHEVDNSGSSFPWRATWSETLGAVGAFWLADDRHLKSKESVKRVVWMTLDPQAPWARPLPPPPSSWSWAWRSASRVSSRCTTSSHSRRSACECAGWSPPQTQLHRPPWPGELLVSLSGMQVLFPPAESLHPPPHSCGRRASFPHPARRRGTQTGP